MDEGIFGDDFCKFISGSSAYLETEELS